MKKTTDKYTKEFKLECRSYLFSLGISDLRAYGREIGVARPTTKNKEDLIEDIVCILSGELDPITISNQGAPVKNNHVDERIPAKIKEIKKAYFYNKNKESLKEGELLYFYEPTVVSSVDAHFSKTLRTGQIVSFEEGYYVVDLQYKRKSEMIFLNEELMESFGLREGDKVSFYARAVSENEMVVEEIVNVNDVRATAFIRRPNFDELSFEISSARICLFDGKNYTTPTLKYIEWLLPLSKGKRGCIIAPPKAGKSKLLLQVAEAASVLNPNVEVYALLLEQTPEAIQAFENKILKERLLYTTYDDDSDKNVHLANFMLNRLKRRAEQGKDVLLIIDSLSVLARAFNDMEETMGGKMLSSGLNEKTVQYIRKYFSNARCLKDFGSLSILGAVNQDTGIPFDDAICAEFSAQANYEIRLSDALARRHIFPAIDVLHSHERDCDLLQSEEERKIDCLVRGEFLPKMGVEGLLQILEDSSSYAEFIRQLSK